MATDDFFEDEVEAECSKEAPAKKDAGNELKHRALKAKERGNEAYRKGDNPRAIQLYSDAIAVDADDHSLYSNRSAAYASQRKYHHALKDADQCLRLKPDWPKGYARRGHAQYHLGRGEDATKTYKLGLSLDPKCDFLKDALKMVQSELDMKRSAARRKRLEGYFQKVVNPLGLGWFGAIAYAVGAMMVLLFILLRSGLIPVTTEGDETGMSGLWAQVFSTHADGEHGNEGFAVEEFIDDA